LKRVCAWCGVTLGPGDRPEDAVVTHGICASCSARFFSPGSHADLQGFLDRLPVPILVVDGNVRILGANSAAQELLGRSIEELRGQLGGDAIECEHAARPGGCGRTLHCKACAIRNTVADTHGTSRSHRGVPATREVGGGEGLREAAFHISTEKLGGFVLLRIDGVPEPT
jgi:PAS domain-containing protein